MRVSNKNKLVRSVFCIVQMMQYAEYTQDGTSEQSATVVASCSKMSANNGYDFKHQVLKLSDL